MELILLLFISPLPVTLVVRFNPCFIGTYSFTMKARDQLDTEQNVLILVLLELILLLIPAFAIRPILVEF